MVKYFDTPLKSQLLLHQKPQRWYLHVMGRETKTISVARNRWTHTGTTVPQSHGAENTWLSAEVRARRSEIKSETFLFSCRDGEHVVCVAARFKSHRFFLRFAVKKHIASRQLHCMFSSLSGVCGFPLSQRSLSLRRARGCSLNSAPRLLITPRAQTLFLCVALRLTTLLFVLQKNNPTVIFCRMGKKKATNMKNSAKTRLWLKLLTAFVAHTSLHDSGYRPVVKSLVFL